MGAERLELTISRKIKPSSRLSERNPATQFRTVFRTKAGHLSPFLVEKQVKVGCFYRKNGLFGNRRDFPRAVRNHRNIWGEDSDYLHIWRRILICHGSSQRTKKCSLQQAARYDINRTYALFAYWIVVIGTSMLNGNDNNVDYNSK